MREPITNYRNDLLAPHMTWESALLEDCDYVWLYDVVLKTPIGPFTKGAKLVAAYVDWTGASIYLQEEWGPPGGDDDDDDDACEERDRRFTFSLNVSFGRTVAEENHPAIEF